MDRNWYVAVDGKTYGPYTWAEMYKMSKTGNIVTNSMIYHEELGGWIKAWTVKELGFPENTLVNAIIQPGQMGTTDSKTTQSQVTQVKSQYPKKKSGCLKGCLTVFGVFLILAVLVSVFVIRPLFNKDVIDTGRQKQVVKIRIDHTGGIVEVKDNNSLIDGMTIDIPSGAYNEDLGFKVSTKEIKSHELGEYFKPILPMIHVDNGGDYSEDVMTVSIPIDIDDDMFAMALYFKDDGTLEPIQMVSQTNNKLVFGVRHFSDILVTALPKALLDEYVGEPNFDTGFKPGIDNWPFVNHGAEISPKGNCNGMSLSMIHYYLHHKKKGEPSLHTYIDNNFYNNTPKLDRDDSQGIRLVSMVQKDAEFGPARDWYFDAIHRNRFMTDKQVFYHFAYAFLLSDQSPQIVGLFVRTVTDGKVKIVGGHAIVAYAMDKEGIFVCDPNYPDRTDLKIPFNGENFGIYSTALNAEETARPYNSFSLVGTTSVISEGYIENLFDNLKENPYKSEIGDLKMSNPSVKYLIIDEGELFWVSDVEAIEIKPEDAIIYKEKVLEYISDNNLSETMGGYVPTDWGDRMYIATTLNNGMTNLNDEAHHMTYKLFKDNSETHIVQYALLPIVNYFFIPIEEGANDVAFEFKRRVEYGKDNNNAITYRYSYTDFQRIKILFGEIDLTGKWHGEFQIDNMGNAVEYAEGLAFQITKGIGWIVSQMTGKELTAEELREIANSSVEVNESAKDPFPLTVTLSNRKGNYYDAKVVVETDGTYEYNVEAVLNGDQLLFTLLNDDGSSFEFTYYIHDNSHMRGEFELRYGGVKEFVSGVSKLTKK